ncbi:TetR/AcrR family transcriptional regulator [Rhodococcoides kyotonense]|nr:TetR/AcrR family transcriptional regulator [Rhodococcus kyotonensis]
MSKEQILDTAEELFAERGYYETSLKDVAVRCQYSVGSIYSFFENKDKLYEQVLMRRSIALEEIRERLPDAMAGDDRLIALADIWVEHSLEHLAWGALTAEVSRIARSRGGVVPDPWRHHGQRVHLFLVEVIEKGQREGTLRPGSPETLARLYQAVLMAFVLVTSMGQRTESADMWLTDTESFLQFLHDTFSTRPREESAILTE